MHFSVNFSAAILLIWQKALLVAVRPLALISALFRSSVELPGAHRLGRQDSQCRSDRPNLVGFSISGGSPAELRSRPVAVEANALSQLTAHQR